MAALFVAGGILALLAIAGPHAKSGDAFVGALAAAAVVIGAVLFGRSPRSSAALPVVVVLGAVVLDVAVIATHDPQTPYALFYPWLGGSAFFFLRPRAALLVLAFVAAGYGGALALSAQPGSDEAARWVLTIGTTGVVGAMAGLLRRHAAGLHVRASDAAVRDTLTGILNRRGFEHALDLEVERAARGGRAVSVLIADLDGLKALNVASGRYRGDEVILAFARLAASGSRRIDVVARVGGDQVALVLPDADEHGALLMAERLRRAVRDRCGLTVSAGIATFPKHGDCMDSLLIAAEQALAAAKQLGRDRCVIYSSEVAGSLGAAPELAVRATEHLAAVLVLAETMDLRDAGTARHSQTVACYAEMIATELGLGPEHVERIRIAGVLHDIGKVGVSDDILRKPGRLTDAEMDEIRKHTELGARIVAGANLGDIAEWVLAHHERPDGRGYPIGLTGPEIPLEARILAVADSFEAMTADRVYSAAMPEPEAIAELRAGEGRQFDADVVAAFLSARQREPFAVAEVAT